MSEPEMIGRWYLVPVHCPFSIWHYEPIHWDAEDRPDAWSWVPSRYLTRRFDSSEAAQAFITAHSRQGGPASGLEVVVEYNPYLPLRQAYRFRGLRAVLGVLAARGKRFWGKGLRS